MNWSGGIPAADPKEGGRPGPLRREASPRARSFLGNHSVVQGAETAPLLGAALTGLHVAGADEGDDDFDFGGLWEHVEGRHTF